MKQDQHGFQSKSEGLYFKKKKHLRRVFLKCSYLDSDIQEAAYTSQSRDRRV